jgi:predicted phosphoribosyltransferase
LQSKLNSSELPHLNAVKFRDREHAGNELAEKLAAEAQGPDTLVLGIPRGGVVLADIVATKIGADFDIVIPRKLGAPDNEELAIGAVMQDGTSYLNAYLVNALRIQEDYIQRQKDLQISEIRRRSAAYRKQDLPYRIGGRKVILVDDGIATGATTIASARWVRKQRPADLTIAVPVAPTQSVDVLAEEADRVVALHKSRDFGAVGQFYEHFEAVTDEAVQSIMRSRGLL